MSDYISKQLLLDWIEQRREACGHLSAEAAFDNIYIAAKSMKFDTSDQGEAARLREALAEVLKISYSDNDPISIINGIRSALAWGLEGTEPVGVQIPQEVIDCIQKCRMGFSDRDVMEIAIADYNSKNYKIMQDYARSDFESFLKYMASTCEVGINTGEGKA